MVSGWGIAWWRAFCGVRTEDGRYFNRLAMQGGRGDVGLPPDKHGQL